MKKKLNIKKAIPTLSYILAGAVILAVVFFGTMDKTNTNSTLSLNAVSPEKSKISVDQISELYVVADLSNALNLASAEDVAYNYVTTTTIYNIGQSSADGSTGGIDKPSIIDTSKFSTGVMTYTVQEGDTMDSIAAKFGLTTDQIRWSNKLKKVTDISAGDTLYLTKNISGIVYTVKEDDTLESIASTYGSTVEMIKHMNDLENSELSEGMRIAIEGGTLPEKERPEYVAPVVYQPVTYSYTTYGGSGSRLTMEVIMTNFGAYGGYVWGQCTSYAWYMRQDLPRNLGNASSWAYNAAAAGFPVDHNPQPGDIFQTGAGWYGHVGYVEAVNPDGTIVISEANYNYYAGRITRSLVSASTAASFNYIHRK